MAGPDKDDEIGGNEGGSGIATDVVIKPKPKTKKPALYRVLMLNDDYTPMEFVIHILERFFAKNREDSTRIMLHIHRRGVGLCGIYPYDVAETKVTQVMNFARQHQHPLQCTMEREWNLEHSPQGVVRKVMKLEHSPQGVVRHGNLTVSLAGHTR